MADLLKGFSAFYPKRNCINPKTKWIDKARCSSGFRCFFMHDPVTRTSMNQRGRNHFQGQKLHRQWSEAFSRHRLEERAMTLFETGCWSRYHRVAYVEYENRCNAIKAVRALRKAA